MTSPYRTNESFRPLEEGGVMIPVIRVSKDEFLETIMDSLTQFYSEHHYTNLELHFQRARQSTYSHGSGIETWPNHVYDPREVLYAKVNVQYIGEGWSSAGGVGCEQHVFRVYFNVYPWGKDQEGLSGATHNKPDPHQSKMERDKFMEFAKHLLYPNQT